MQHQYAVSGQWRGGFEEERLKEWAEALRGKLEAPEVSLGLVFIAPKLFPQAPAILEVLRVHARIKLLMGCSSQGLISNEQEIENNAELVLGLYYLPGASLQARRFTQEQVEECNSAAYWHAENEIEPAAVNGWIVFADPFTCDCDTWLQQWNEAYPAIPVLGGLSSAGQANSTQLYLNEDVLEDGGVALAISGEIQLASMISQGCTPFGETWTITRAEQNIIHEIANRPAFDVLAESFERLPKSEQEKSPGNIFIGLVMNEYLEEFHRGDFLVRNLLGADSKSGSLVVGALPRPGQTIQFQRRDAQAASEDLAEMLGRVRRQLGGREILGGCLCSCNGRGYRLFGRPNHDAETIQQTLGPFGLAGFFCNGEIGPVSDRNYLHGYTASLALFVKKSA